MCGRYTFVDTNGFVQRFDITQDTLSLKLRYNVAPGQQMPVVLGGEQNTVAEMKWGLVPHWSKEPGIGYKMINARAEGIESKPSFRKPVRSQRCLVPASGFYEWQKAGKTKIPHYFHLTDSDLFAFAGLYDVWRNPQGQELYTYTIITTAANELVAPIHDRMPVILKREDEDLWLDTAVSDPAEVLRVLVPYPAEGMDVYRVSTRVNTPSVDEQDLLLRNSA